MADQMPLEEAEFIARHAAPKLNPWLSVLLAEYDRRGDLEQRPKTPEESEAEHLDDLESAIEYLREPVSGRLPLSIHAGRIVLGAYERMRDGISGEWSTYIQRTRCPDEPVAVERAREAVLARFVEVSGVPLSREELDAAHIAAWAAYEHFQTGKDADVDG